MKKYSCIRTGLVVLLTLSLSAPCIPTAFAATRDKDKDSQASHGSAATSQLESSATFEKSEAVYANLEADGAPAAIYVVNRFDVEDAGTVVDFGDYTKTQNLTDETELGSKRDATIFEAEEGLFYYQGYAARKVLPWDIVIEYELDGQTVAPDELIGASGDLAIYIHTTQNETIDSAFYDSFMLQITFTLPGDVASDIHAEAPIVSPTIAEAGQNTAVAFAGLPKHDNDFTLTAKVQDFHMPSAQIVALPYSMVIDMPDTDSMVSGMDTLVSAISQLAAGVSGLSSGIDQLSGGAQAFGSGLNQLNSASAQLIAASDQISTALNALDLSQLEELSKGLESLTKILDCLTPERLQQLRELVECAKSILNYYKNHSQEVQAALNALNAYLNTITEEDIAALENYIRDHPDPAHPEYAYTVHKLRQAYEAAKLVANKMADQGYIDTMINYLDSMLGQMEGFINLVTTVKELIDSGAVDELPNFINGLKQYASGVGQYAAGVNELAKNYGQLSSGMSGLADGAGQLNGGMQELNSAVSIIPETMRQQIADMAGEFDFAEFDPISFVSPKNENVRAVQFLMATEALEKPKVKEESEPEPEKTLWERFVALFS